MPHSLRCAALAWLAGPVVFLAAQVVAGLAWHQPPYSWSHYNVSDLGAVTCGVASDGAGFVCSPLHALFNAGTAVAGALIAVGAVLGGRAWGRTPRTTAARVLLIVTGCAYVVGGLRPEDVDLNLHVVAAFVLFPAGNLALLLAAAAPDGSAIGRMRIVSLGLGLLGSAGTVLFLGHRYLFLGMGGMERLAVYPFQAWLVAAAIAVAVATAPARLATHAS